MPGPWEKYGGTATIEPVPSGPWEKYGASPTTGEAAERQERIARGREFAKTQEERLRIGAPAPVYGPRIDPAILGAYARGKEVLGGMLGVGGGGLEAVSAPLAGVLARPPRPPEEYEAPLLEVPKEWAKTSAQYATKGGADILASSMRLVAAFYPEGPSRDKILSAAKRTEAGEVLTFDPELARAGSAGDNLIRALAQKDPETVGPIVRTVADVVGKDPVGSAYLAKDIAKLSGFLGNRALDFALREHPSLSGRRGVLRIGEGDAIKPVPKVEPKPSIDEKTTEEFRRQLEAEMKKVQEEQKLPPSPIPEAKPFLKTVLEGLPNQKAAEEAAFVVKNAVLEKRSNGWAVMEPTAVEFADIKANLVDKAETIARQLGKDPKDVLASMLRGAQKARFGTKIGGRSLPIEPGRAGAIRLPVEEMEAAERAARAVGKVVTGIAPRHSMSEEANVLLADIATKGTAYSAGWKRSLAQAAHDLTNGETAWLKTNMKSAIEKGQPAPEGMQGAQRFMDAWRGTSADVVATAEPHGVLIGERANYFPHWMTGEAQMALASKKGPLFEALAREAGAKGIDINELSEWAKEGFLTKRFGSLERRRMMELPETVKVGSRDVQVLKTNPFDVLPQYLDKAGRRIAVVEHTKDIPVGPDEVAGSNTGKAIQALADKMDVNQAATFKEQMRLAQGEAFFDPLARASRFMRPVTNVAKSAALTTSAIRNAVQGYAPVIAQVGERRFASALSDVLTGKAAREVDFAHSVGAWTDDSLHALQEGTLEGATGGMVRKTLKWTGSEAINTNINKVMAVAMKRRLDEVLEMAQKGDRKAFDAMMKEFHYGPEQVQRILRDGYGKFDYAKAMQYATARVNAAHVLPTEVQRWMTHPFMKDTLVFTGITRTLGNATLDAMLKAKAGDAAPLLRLMGYSSVGTVAADKFINWLRGKDKSGTEEVLDAVFNTNLLGMLGYFGERARFARGEGPVEAAATLRPIWAKTLDIPIKMIRDGSLRPLRQASPLIDIGAVFAGAEPIGRRRAAEAPDYEPPVRRGRYRRRSAEREY